jgi:hypothetical protein
MKHKFDHFQASLNRTYMPTLAEGRTGTEKTGEQSESPTSVQDARRKKSSMVHL